MTKRRRRASVKKRASVKRRASVTRLLTKANAKAIADTFGLSGDVRERVVARLRELSRDRYLQEKLSQQKGLTARQLREKLSLLNKSLKRAELMLGDCVGDLQLFALQPLADHPKAEWHDTKQRVLDDAQGVIRLQELTQHALRILDTCNAGRGASPASSRARPHDQKFANGVFHLWRETVRGQGVSQDHFCHAVFERAGIADGSIGALIKKARTHPKRSSVNRLKTKDVLILTDYDLVREFFEGTLKYEERMKVVEETLLKEYLGWAEGLARTHQEPAGERVGAERLGA